MPLAGMDVSALRPGHVIGQYRILRLLGRGAMGTVWLAQQASLNREVALKVMAPALAGDPTFIARFEREGRTAAALNHPHIVTVFDIGQAEGIWYLSLEYVEGDALSALIKGREDIAPPEAARWGSEIADALAFAHERGVLHRDVKPGNVLVDTWRRARLMDFGIAKSVDATTLTTHATLGTPYYMAPELGEGAAASAATDQYALGILLYEMVTGQVPFRGESPLSVLYQHRHGTPLPMGRMNPAAPPALVEAVMRAMSRFPEDRFSDCGALAEALRMVSAGAAVNVPGLPATSPTAPEPSMRDTPTAAMTGRTTVATVPDASPDVPGRPRAFWAGLAGAVVALTLGAALVGARWSMRRDAPVPDAAPSGAAHTVTPPDAHHPPGPPPPSDVSPVDTRPPTPPSAAEWHAAALSALGRGGSFTEDFLGFPVLLREPVVHGTPDLAWVDGGLHVAGGAEVDWRAMSLRPVLLATCELLLAVEPGSGGEAGLLFSTFRGRTGIEVLLDGAGTVRVVRVSEAGRAEELGRRTIAADVPGAPVRLLLRAGADGMRVEANGVTIRQSARDWRVEGFAGIVMHGPVGATFDRMVVRARRRLDPARRRLRGVQPDATLRAH